MSAVQQMRDRYRDVCTILDRLIWIEEDLDARPSAGDIYRIFERWHMFDRELELCGELDDAMDRFLHAAAHYGTTARGRYGPKAETLLALYCQSKPRWVAGLLIESRRQ